MASASPRRRELLRDLVPQFQIIPAKGEENAQGAATPKELVCMLAKQQAGEGAALPQAKGKAVLGADTVVAFQGEVLGKPVDKQDAARMLTMLSGKDHYVYTGITVTDADTMESVSEYEKTVVSFKELTSKEIEYYTDNYNVLDKAGSYGIQGGAALFAEKMVGDYYNVMGLPVCRLWQLLSQIAPEIMEDIL